MDSPTDVAPAPGAAPPPSGPRRLRRRPDDGHIAGVCAGVAEYFNVDPVIVRIAAVVLLFSGPGAFAYVLAWIFVPPADGPAVFGAAQAPIDRKDRATQVFGVVLIVLAVSVFWGDWWSPARHWLLPLGLMGLGAWLLLRRGDDDAVAPSPPAPPSTPAAPPAAWTAGATSTDVTAPVAVDPDEPPDAAGLGEATVGDGVGTETDPTAEGALPLAGDDGGGGEPPTAPWSAPPLPVPPADPSAPSLPPARRRRVLGPIVFGTLLVWAGLAVLVGVTLEAGLAGGLLIIGVGFVLGAFVGGSRVLILPALLVGAALAVTAVIDIPLEGPVGQQRWAPTSVAELEDRYEVSLGEGTLDLLALDLPAGDDVDVAATVGVGHLVVLVPDGLAVDVTADIGAGESDVFGLQQNGVGVEARRSAAGDGTGGTLALSVEVGVGQVEVRQVPGAVAGTVTDTTPTTALG